MSERADFLLEIGCEDLPPHFLPYAHKTLIVLGDYLLKAYKDWDENNDFFITPFLPMILTFGEFVWDKNRVISFESSRRLTLLIKEIDFVIQASAYEIKGPPEKVVRKDNGDWNDVFYKFIQKNNLDTNNIYVRTDEKSGVKYIVGKQIQSARDTIQLLQRITKSLIEQFMKVFPRTMHWGSGEFTFPRPLRWIVALLGSQVINFEIAGVRSGNTSYGHRFLAPEPFTITSVEQYLQELSQRYVVLDGEERRKRIREHGDKLAAERHARIVWDEDLQGVVADQVEYPQTLIGEFPADFAELPRALISATLTGYQKYFPLEDASGKLLPCFLAIYDSSPEAEQNVRHGNQSTLSSRLADAKFFYEHDLNTGLATMREHLAGRGYLPGMGTVLDKSERLIHITEYLADEVEKGNPGIIVDREALKKAAEYCKADLESTVVGEKEFAHLQGEMGFHYALAEKLPAITALAIREHYSPRAAGDPPASTTEGRIVALADKLDHLAALASIGKLPKGGDDPFGARRAAVGVIINTLGLSEAEIAARKSHYGLKLDLQIIYDVGRILGSKEDITPNVIKFIVDRFINLMDDCQIVRKDYLFGLVTQHGNDLAGCYRRILVVDEALRTLPAWQTLSEAAKRCRNIVDAAERDGITIGNFAPELFELAEEKELAATLENVTKNLPPAEQVGTELSHFEVLSCLRDPLHEFFAKVFVMVDDIKVRDNRLGLLRAVYVLFGNIMDFSKIEIVTKKDI
jgi:glycyl-tRNA synthetase beta chain